MFYFIKEGVQVYVLIYVDDILVTGNEPNVIDQFVANLNDEFALKDLGELSYFLGIEVHRDDTGFHLSQKKYILDLLDRLDMMHIKPCHTPAVTGKYLSANKGEPLPNPTTYRSAIGGLQYLTNTRPDISYIVNKLSQFLQFPTTIHWQAVKRVLRYLKGTLSHGLSILKSNTLQIIAFSDVDWACCVDDRKSIAAYCVFIGDSLVSWSSKKQHVVSRSSTESEYRSLAHVAAEVSWIQSLLSEIGQPSQSTPIAWCDNMSALFLAANPVFHSRSKHVELDIHFVRDKVLAKQLDVRYVPSKEQLADGLTKALSEHKFSSLRHKLCVIASPSRLRGGVKITH